MAARKKRERTWIPQSCSRALVSSNLLSPTKFYLLRSLPPSRAPMSEYQAFRTQAFGGIFKIQAII